MMIVAGIGVVPIAKRVAPRRRAAALAFSIVGYILVAVTAGSRSLPLLIVAFVRSASASARPRRCRTS